jgi:hypothetical protein
MRKTLIGVILAFTMLLTALSVAEAGEPSCNWGELTSAEIADGFPQGPHSSDPSGDGHGPGSSDEPRVGLANIVNQGDLNALCEFIGA